MKDSIDTITTEVAATILGIVDEAIEQVVKPLLIRRKEMERSAFDKAYPDLVEALREV